MQSSDGPHGTVTRSISFDRVRKTYRKARASIVAVDDVSFEVASGTAVGLLGPNGAGKTTLLRILGRLVIPDSGSVRVAGVDVTKRRQSLRDIGIVLEGGHDIHERLTALENIEYFGRLMGVEAKTCRARGQYLLEQFGLQKSALAQARHLSRGMRQALSLCVALVHRPQFLVLDEPTLGLDPGAVTALTKLVAELKSEDLGILIASHDLGFVQEVSDRVLIIGGGRILKESAVPNLLRSPGHQEFQIQLARPPLWSGEPPRLQCGHFAMTPNGIEVVCSAADLAQMLEALAPFGVLHIESIRRTLIDEYLAVQRGSMSVGRAA